VYRIEYSNGIDDNGLLGLRTMHNVLARVRIGLVKQLDYCSGCHLTEGDSTQTNYTREDGTTTTTTTTTTTGQVCKTTRQERNGWQYQHNDEGNATLPHCGLTSSDRSHEYHATFLWIFHRFRVNFTFIRPSGHHRWQREARNA
jgi:hypothetical protein